MRVRVNDPRHLRDLLLHLRECGCVAEQVSADEADVTVPAAPDPRAARLEVGVYLVTWRIRTVGGSAEITG
jgi:hypothetical protein